jgi:elongation factor Ts
MANVEEIKALREETGLSIAQCRFALDEAGGDRQKALDILKRKGAEIASKKADRSLGAGAVVAYIHTGDTVGVLLELVCETDFVSKNPEFKATGKDIAMHIAAMDPADITELLTQPFIKNPSKTISDMINGTVQKFGERTEISRFTRFSIK